MNDKTYLILPGCDDTNRGDQALIWQTISLAEAAGYRGCYYMLAEPEKYKQSAAEGIRQLDYVLRHPSSRYSKNDNIRYTVGLKLKWAVAAALDLVTCEPLAHRWARKLLLPLYSKKTKETLRRFQQADAVFVKGGGFLHAHGGWADTYKIYYFLYHIRLAQSFGKKIYVMPNSFGPFHSPFVKGMIRRTLGKCSAVMSRESISQKMLQEDCGVTSEVFADLAFYLEADAAFDPYAVLEEKGIPCQTRKCVAITARPYRFPGERDGELKYEAYKAALVGFVAWLDCNGYYPVLVEHVFSDLEHENDMTCINEIVEMLGSECHYSVFANRQLTCRQMKQVYGTFAYTVGTRFHSVIFSLASGVPSVAITYGGNKGDGIMQDLGLEKYALPIHEITAEKLIEAFQSITQSTDEVSERTAVMMDRLCAQREQIISKIRK